MKTNEKPEAPIATPIDENVEAIAGLMADEQNELNTAQKAIERFSSVMAAPAFLFTLLLASGAWMVINVGMKLAGRVPIDPPPFGWLQTATGFLSLMLALVIVSTQRRQGKLNERNAHLDLQINLLVDKRTAKIVQLLEEMRLDSPSLRNRKDEEAETLKAAANPLEVATLIADKLPTVVVEPTKPTKNSETKP